MARGKSTGSKATSSAHLGFEARLRLPGQLFYSTQIPVCLWFEVKRNALDASNDSRLFDGETKLSLVV